MATATVKPYLRLPFCEWRFLVEEGWYYSDEERRIHRYRLHRGVDFSLKRGAPILAAHAGYALASYQHDYRRLSKKIMSYQGKPIGFGYGNFVQIYNPQNQRCTLYGHLQKVSKSLPFVRPHGLWPRLVTPTFRYTPHQFVTRGKLVKAGDVIGWCGDSGCTWGYRDYPPRPKLRAKPSWDGVHLHFEEFALTGSGQRHDYSDPFGLYGGSVSYPTTLLPRQLNQLWL